MVFKAMLRWMSNYVKSFDVYGKTFTFTYKGEDQLRTFWGGWVSFVIVLTLFLNSISLFIVMITRDDSSIYSSTIFNDLSRDTKLLSLANSTFQFAVRLSNYKNETFSQDDSYFSMKLVQNTDIGEAELEEQIRYSIWGDRFNYNFQTDQQATTVSNDFLWPETYDFQLQGDGIANTFKYVSLIILKWENGTGIIWQDQTAIDNAVNQLHIDIIIVNTYFDHDDYKSPIKTYLESGFDFQTINGTTSKVRGYFEENESERQDDYFAITPVPIKEKFVKLVNSDFKLSYGDSEIFTFSFLKSNQKQNVKRAVFRFVDLFGIIGGTSEIFFIFGGFFVTMFSNRLSNYSILTKLYHVDTISWQKDHEKCFNDLNLIKASLNSNFNKFQENRSVQKDQNYDEGENNCSNIAVNSIHSEK